MSTGMGKSGRGRQGGGKRPGDTAAADHSPVMQKDNGAVFHFQKEKRSGRGEE